MASQSVARSSATIEYRRIRVPREDGATLQIPPLSELDALWQTNVDLVDAAGSSTQEFDSEPPAWEALRTRARREAIDVAFRYSAQYLPEQTLNRLRTRQRVVMAGHQPELFHAGVWYKNFVLSGAAEKLNALPINLIVDSDLSTRQSIAIPKSVRQESKSGSVTKLVYGSVPYDQPTPPQPYETQTVADGLLFRQFPQQVVETMRAYNGTETPLAVPLWQNAIGLLDAKTLGREPSSGHLIAAARHRLEAEHGLATLEVPLSQLCQTGSFADFASQLFANANRFREIYNAVLLDYREVHGIRSRSHPVPELDVADGDWCELPFWIWSHVSKRRRPLFVKQDRGQTLLSDLHGLTMPIDTDAETSWLIELEREGVSLRPRALVTTLYCRLFLSDLFLHGVGGAKYDQLTDAIAAQFWQIELPSYMTLSASFHLPSQLPRTSPGEVTALRVKRREMNFHPETFLQPPHPPETAALIAQKRAWLEGENESVRSQEKHDAITAINAALRALLPETDDELKTQETTARSQLRESEIVTSREFSFCLFDERLIDSLKRATGLFS